MQCRNQADVEYVNNRRVSMLWYAWGRQDADPTSTAIDPMALAHEYALCAKNYREERVCFLASVQDYWQERNQAELARKEAS